MKMHFLLPFFLLVAVESKADCLGCPTGLIWPMGKTISVNTIFVFETDQTDIVEAMQQKKFFYLKTPSSKSRINFTVVEINNGLGIDQVVLRPSIPLTEGKEYSLHYVSNKTPGESPKEIALRKWLVRNKADTLPPVWLKQPEIQRKMFVAYGCGPLCKVFFSFNTADIPHTLIKAIVKNKSTGQVKHCYLKSNNALFELGHDMCCGEFVFSDLHKSKDEYEVQFILINESGNTSTASAPLNFIQPNPEDS